MGRKRLAKWYAAANKRRGDLIFNRNRTPEEDAELQELQQKCLDEVNRVHPHPPVDMKLLEALEQKLKADKEK